MSLLHCVNRKEPNEESFRITDDGANEAELTDGEQEEFKETARREKWTERTKLIAVTSRRN